MERLFTKVASFRSRLLGSRLMGGRSWAPHGYETCTVDLPSGESYQLVLDVGTDDPIALAYRSGHHANAYLTGLLAEFTKPGDCVLDLGAHIGTVSLAAAASGCHVIAVDASPKHADLLSHSVARNNFARMHVVNAAVGTQEGFVEFHLAGLWGMVARPDDVATTASAAPKVRVRSATGDALLRELKFDRVDFIKIDVEGSEVAAIRGLERLLRRDDGPIISYECNGLTLPQFGYSSDELISQLDQYGYKTFRYESGSFRPVVPQSFQPESWIDLIAFKDRHIPSISHRIVDPLSVDEIVDLAAQEGRKAHHVQREYIASALALAGPEILGNPLIRSVLDDLVADEKFSVQNTALWWPRRKKLHSSY